MARKRAYPTPLGRARAHEDAQNARLSGAGHLMKWQRKTGTTEYQGTCRRCGGRVDCDEYGAHWRALPGAPSLLRYMGVNIIRRCPGGL